MPLSATRNTLRWTVLVLLLGLASCTRQPDARDDPLRTAVDQSLAILGKTRADLATPRLDDSYPEGGRLGAVEQFMNDGLRVPAFARTLQDSMDTQTVSALFNQIATGLADRQGYLLKHPAEQAVERSQGSDDAAPARPSDNPELQTAVNHRPVLRHLLEQLNAQGELVSRALNGMNVTRSDVLTQVRVLVSSRATAGQSRWLTNPELHRLGAGFPVDSVRIQAGLLLEDIEQHLPALLEECRDLAGSSWNTAAGRVVIGTNRDDSYAGSYLLLIEPGGNDHYHNVTAAPLPGNVSLVIDVSGNDSVTWEGTAGPGAGILGTGIWLDLAGDDHYSGDNFGAGSALFGAGILVDLSGNDTYSTGSTSLGAAYYGVGLLADRDGDDRYTSALSSQGFGGSGGLGILADYAGNDHYDCGHVVPDQGIKRIRRHTGQHFMSMCQGYGFGMRLQESGGIGLLLDRAGDDSYETDIFGQGGGYWFATGMLFDYAGNDSYHCFEHCQGESLHAGAGFLADFSGNDSYQGVEHAQGVGLDHAIGLLLDAGGDDNYQSSQLSQGAGLGTDGIGILLDQSGVDHYSAQSTSQGYAAPNADNGSQGEPIGLLLDLAGVDSFRQGDSAAPGPQGRISGKTGIAIDHPALE